MVSFFEKIRDFIKSLINLFISLFKILLLAKFKVKFPKSENDTIAFLANGPSLNEALVKIKKNGLPKDIMVTNFFINTDLFHELKPNNYVICDPLFNYSGFQHDDRIKKFYKDLFSTNWHINFFIPFRFKKDYEKIKTELNISNSNIICYCYNDTNLNGRSNFTLSLMRKKLGIPRPTTVAIPSVFNCMHMGYKKIIIAGIDLNQHLDIKVGTDNTLKLKSKHFYSDGKEVYQPWYKDHINKITYKTSEIFLIFYRFFYSFDILADYAKKYKHEIINYSDNSFLDQFKKNT
jgi:hypothetical protein